MASNLSREDWQQRAEQLGFRHQAFIDGRFVDAASGKTFDCIFDRKEGKYFIGRTEYDSPDVDNNVIVDGSRHYIQIGHFVNVRITEATDFDLYGEPV